MLHRITRDPIILPVRPLRDKDSVTMQKQHWTGLHVVPNEADNTLTVTVTVRCYPYAYDTEAADFYGPRLPLDKGRGYYDETFTADNDSAVDLSTGKVAFERPKLLNGNGQPMSNEEFEAFIEALPGMYVLQGDAFLDVLLRQKVNIADELRTFMADADEPPYFRFGAAERIA